MDSTWRQGPLLDELEGQPAEDPRQILRYKLGCET